VENNSTLPEKLVSLKDAFDFAEFMWANIKPTSHCFNGYYTNLRGDRKTVSDFWVSFQYFRKSKQSPLNT